MFEAAIRTLQKIENGRFIFICRAEHIKEHNLEKILLDSVPNSVIIPLEQETEGSICTVLKAEQHLDLGEPVIIKDCDQVVNFEPNHFLEFMNRNAADGAVISVITSDPGYSFVKVAGGGIVETAEKIVISNLGSAGVYYFRRGEELVSYARRMIAKDIRTNNEFYVCPVYNEYIADGKVVLNYPIAEMFQLGTPEDYERNMDAVIAFLEKLD